MQKIKSLLLFIKESNYNPFSIIHGLAYTATGTYVKILVKILEWDWRWFKDHTDEAYHGKIMRLDDATKFVTINRNVTLKNLDKLLPFKHAKDIILKNPHNILAYECACRSTKENACKPSDVCIVIGDPFVDILETFKPFHARRVSPEEALQILKEEDERGHIHTAFFKTAMLNRFYTICNCCMCCCQAMRANTEFDMNMVLPSGYRGVIGDDCVGCGECAKYCRFKAIETFPVEVNGKKRKRSRIIAEKCMGCGICESKCKKETISMVLDPEKGPPLDIEDLARAQNQ